MLSDEALSAAARLRAACHGLGEDGARGLLTREMSPRCFTDTRSDGSAWTLTLADVFERSRALEIACNPNDCVEARWGAPPASEETCRRHAPADQAERMRRSREWFGERRRRRA